VLTNLDLLKGSHVHGLDEVLTLQDLLLEDIEGDELILNDAVDLELLDTVTDRDELGLTPQETLHGDATDVSLKGSHVGLIIPRLDIKGAHGLGNGLGLGGLLGGVLGKTLLLDLLGLLIDLLIVRAEKVDILIIIGGSGSSGGSSSGTGPTLQRKKREKESEIGSYKIMFPRIIAQWWVKTYLAERPLTEAMCLYQRAAWGNEASLGPSVKALKTSTSLSVASKLEG